MTPAPTSSTYFKWWICVLLLLASTLNYMDRQALSLTAKRVSEYLEIGNRQFGRFESAFSIGFALGAITLGWLADRGNIRLVYAAMVVLWSLAGFASGFAESYLFLLACRFALGLFEAGNVPCGIITVKRVLRPEERALGNGMFQSGSALGAVLMPFVVLACLSLVDQFGAAEPGFTWQLPFRVVGAAGLIWALVWLVTVRSHHVQAPPASAEPSTSDTYFAIFRNRRFWVALVVVTSINTPWRSFGFWLPKLLQEEKQFSETTMLGLVPGFYLAADLGSLAVGAVILWLARRGVSLPSARLFCFTLCTGLTMLSILSALLPKGPLLVVILYLLGFGALGLFPIYYALSQDISMKHQGKVTGTLSCLNAGYLALLFYAQGWLIDYLQSYALALGVVGVAPLAGVIALAFFWSPRRARA